MVSGVREAWRDLRNASVDSHTSSVRMIHLRWILAVAWLAGLGAWFVLKGPPQTLRLILFWLALAMLVASIGNPLGWAKSMLIDWLPLYLVLVGYDIAHGLADNLGVRPHVDPQLSFDQALFGTDGLTDPLQSWLWRDSGSWYDQVFLVVYLSHFVVTLAVCAALWMRSRELFLAYRRRVLSMWFLALGFFAVFPTVPPWMAAQQGHLPPMVRVVELLLTGSTSSDGSEPFRDADGRISLANPVAAVPSLHSALPMLLLFFVWPMVGRYLRAALLLYTVLMAFVLVYGGEHYVFDVLAGWALAAAIHVPFTVRDRTRDRRKVDDPVLATTSQTGDPTPASVH